MMHILWCTAWIVVLADGVTSQCLRTDNWEAVNGQCMMCLDTPTHYFMAKVLCLERGGRLTSIHNLEQRVFVESCARDLAGNEDVWVGLIVGDYDGGEVPVPGTLAWQDGTPYNYDIPFEAGADSVCAEIDDPNQVDMTGNCFDDQTIVCSMPYGSCPGLGEIANGEIKYNTTQVDNGYWLNTLANYTCNEGYAVSGEAIRTCDVVDTWSSVETIPTCSPVACEALANPENGTVAVQGLTYGSVAVYSCASGHTLSGDARRSCGAAGTWTGEAPTCNAAADSNDLELGLAIGGGVLGALILGGLVTLALRPRAPAQMALTAVRRIPGPRAPGPGAVARRLPGPRARPALSYAPQFRPPFPYRGLPY